MNRLTRDVSLRLHGRVPSAAPHDRIISTSCLGRCSPSSEPTPGRAASWGHLWMGATGIWRLPPVQYFFRSRERKTEARNPRATGCRRRDRSIGQHPERRAQRRPRSEGIARPNTRTRRSTCCIVSARDLACEFAPCLRRLSSGCKGDGVSKMDGALIHCSRWLGGVVLLAALTPVCCCR